MIAITMAIGSPTWGNLALNLALSIKANDLSQEICLIYEDSAIAEMPESLMRYFDYQIKLKTNNSGHCQAFKIKTYLPTLLESVGLLSHGEFIYIDADCIMLPSKKLSSFKFDTFQTWCNGSYNFETDIDSANGYTYWVEPKELLFEKGIMPQTNTSFIYFDDSKSSLSIFSMAKLLSHNSDYNCKKYKDCVPDEFLFNVSCALNGYPMKEFVYPIFFQFANDYQNATHVLHHYAMMGFAGEDRPSKWFVKQYNEYANYYREYFGVSSWDYTKKIVDADAIKLNTQMRYIAKAGELPNSDGGVFNPDGVIMPNGDLVVVVRKERNLDAYKKTYASNTAIAHFFINGKDDGQWIPDVQDRVEDFRLYLNHSGHLIRTYTRVEKDRTYIAGGMNGLEIILPIIPKKVEKNWAFFSYANVNFCVYSLSPYILFYRGKTDLEWSVLHVAQHNFKWFHSGHTICNSTNPILVDNWFLMFFHTKEAGLYFHGAVLIDKTTLEIHYSTKNSIHIMDEPKGLHEGLVYVSGCVYLEKENIIRVYAGEADWNAVEVDFNKDELIKAIIGN